MKDEPDDGKRPMDLKARTRAFALRIIRLFGAIPKTEVGKVLGRQVLRSGTSVGAHYREGCRARSDAEFISKLEAGSQELEETMYWLELIGDAELIELKKLSAITQEANELMAIFTTIIKVERSDFILQPSAFILAHVTVKSR